VFGGKAHKRVKSNRSSIGSVTTIERAFPMERTSALPVNRAADGHLERVRISALEFQLARGMGGHGEAGMESEEGTAFESLPRRKLCRKYGRSALLVFESAVHGTLELKVSVAVEIDVRVQSGALPARTGVG
jgi:hypothetical protein